MRNLKSMVAFLVVAAMLFASVTSFAYGDVAADADYATAVEVLSALEILKGDDKGNFNPDNTITRAESAAVIVRLLGLEEAAAGAAGATQFVDVAADHWGSGYINMAAQSGIIAGYGDGNFGPEDAVTYEQFVKMLVCALGYEPKALTKGTYPTGYLIAAKEMKLTKGVSGSAGQEAARAIVAELAYNALDIDLMEQSGWGSDISYDVAEGKTLLTEKLEIEKVEANVASIIDNEEFKLGTETVLSNGINVAPFVGYAVEAYLSENAKEEKVLEAIVKDTDLTSIVISAADIDVSEAGLVKYFDENDDEVELTYTTLDEDDATVYPAYYVNGEAGTLSAALSTAPNTVYELLVDDEDVIKTVFASVYTYAIVDKWNASRERIDFVSNQKPSGAKYISLTEEVLEDITYTLVDANGAEVAVEDLKENDVLVIKTNKKGSAVISYEMVVASTAVEGKIKSYNKDKELDEYVYAIGDTKYPVSYYTFAGSYATTAAAARDNWMGKEGTFYLDPQGKIINFEPAESEVNLAFICSTSTVADQTTYSVKVLDKDGLNTYTLDENVKVEVVAAVQDDAVEGVETEKVNGVEAYEGLTFARLKGSDIVKIETEGTTPVNHITSNFYEIETNANGVITKLIPATVGASVAAAYSEKLVKMVAEDEEDPSAFVADDVVIFNVPAGKKVTDLSIAGLASLVDEKDYTYYVLDTDDETDEITAMVVVSGTASASAEAPIAIVTDIATVYDEDETPISELTVLVEGEEKTILSDTAYEIGTVLTYVLDADGKIEDAITIAAIEEVENSNDVIDVAAEDTDERTFVYGRVDSINAKGVATVNGTDIKLVDVTEVYSVDFSKKAPFAVATVADLEESDEEAFVDNDDMPVEAHYALFVLDEDGALVSLIIVVPNDDAAYGEAL